MMCPINVSLRAKLLRGPMKFECFRISVRLRFQRRVPSRGIESSDVVDAKVPVVPVYAACFSAELDESAAVFD